ncbi:hypothetical protein [Paenibacillus campinasensis]|uniref:Uncharacterized protein n=1 Tax=Paenibacillus campinasensis TaxID=66347 RepID=A0A268ENL2_9BACL|nr:hypothetical protein [Paenibacillus campinasensis]PAD74703.1 hypothetical protein CHH67_17165 [Paenibacillus campinasensis]
MRTIIYLLITLSIVFLIFIFGNSMTTRPGTTSGNGNPAILLFVPLVILFIVLISQWFKVFRHTHVKLKNLIIMTVLLVGHQVIGVYVQIISFRNYRDFLAEIYAQQYGTVDWEYIHSITSGLSIHINNQYFNVNTYFLFIGLSLLVWLLSRIVHTAGRR